METQQPIRPQESAATSPDNIPFSALRISDNIPVDPPPDEPNPWNDLSPETPIKLPGISSTNILDVDLNSNVVRTSTQGVADGDDRISVPEVAVVSNRIENLDVAVVLGADSKESEKRKKEVLEEFDPLVNQEEKEAREAWEMSESHPPLPPSSLGSAVPAVPSQLSSKELEADSQPIPTESSVSEATLAEPQPPIPPTKDIDEDKDPSDTGTTHVQSNSPPRPPSPPKPTFPALAALAKTFSLPLGNRTRPRSLDLATSVPSPATLSSFASQQQLPPKSGGNSPDRVSTPGPGLPSSSTTANGPEVGSGSGTGTSTPGKSSRHSSRGRGEDGADVTPAFDFQKFLDQMKLKGADPVAKYLRSYVSVIMSKYPCTDILFSFFLCFVVSWDIGIYQIPQQFRQEDFYGE